MLSHPSLQGVRGILGRTFSVYAAVIARHQHRQRRAAPALATAFHAPFQAGAVAFPAICWPSPPASSASAAWR